MTLILGINLTDSVYLAADTRVTRMYNGEIIGTHDNLLKLWGNQNGIFCAVAGDAGLAKHLLVGLQKESFARRGIESVRQHIEAYIYETADSYWQNKGRTTAATILFAGHSQHKRCYINRELARKLVEAHFANNEARNERGGSKFLLYNDIAYGPEAQHRTKFNYTTLFAVQITEQGVQVTESEPGQHLVYGSPGLVREDIELKDIARIEFGDANNNPMLMTAYINLMREKRNLTGVSSTVVPIHVQPDGTSILVTGTTYSIKLNDRDTPAPEIVSSIAADDSTGKFYRVENGQRIELVSIAKYSLNDTDGMTIMII